MIIEQTTLDFNRVIHANSARAYHEERKELGKRAMAILAEIRINGGGTDRQIMQRMGFFDPNCVRPRITELIDAGLLQEVANIECKITGKMVRRVEVV